MGYATKMNLLNHKKYNIINLFPITPNTRGAIRYLSQKIGLICIAFLIWVSIKETIFYPTRSANESRVAIIVEYLHLRFDSHQQSGI